MGSVDRLGGARLGWKPTPGAIARERVAGFVLLCLFLGLALLLVGACNTQGFPAPPPGGGPGGGGGPSQQGAGGTGRTRDGGGPAGPGGIGGSIGPGGPYDGGAPNACARPATFSCCDQTTGAMTQPPCGVDGLIADCPMGTLPEKLYICIPPSLDGDPVP
jgi:hypothetical protein